MGMRATRQDLTALTASRANIDRLIAQKIEVASGSSGLIYVNDLLDAATDSANFFVGSTAPGLTSGTNNTGVGLSALNGVTSGADNTALGINAGLGLTTESESVYIGPNAGSTAAKVAASCVIIGADASSNASGGVVMIGKGTTNVASSSSDINAVIIGTDAQGARYGVTIGTSAGLAHADAVGNVIIGTSAGNSCEGSDNVIVGYGTASALTTGDSNVLIGNNADNVSVTASDCVAIGNGSRAASNGGVSVGSNALSSATTASDCIAVGYYSLENVTTGSAIGMGSSAGLGFVSGDTSVFIGDASGTPTAACSGAVAVGDNAEAASTSVSVGERAGWNCTTAAVNNVFVGRHAGYHVADGNQVSGTQNVAIGQDAGQNIGSGALNTVVGAEADMSAVNLSDGTVVGATAFGAAGSTVVGSAAGATTGSIAIGHNSAATGHANCIVINSSGASDAPRTSSAANQLVIALGASNHLRTGLTLGGGAPAAANNYLEVTINGTAYHLHLTAA